MGMYLNPGNGGFSGILNGEYVDKTGLIGLLNQTIETPQRLTCVSRPRRFGKSYAAQMLCAYYDKTCDSSTLFQNLKIAKDRTYETHRNRYDVIYLDMTNILGKAGAEGALAFLQGAVSRELLKSYPGIPEGAAFDETLLNAVELIGNKFIMIIDEWDAPVRETPEIEKQYLDFLRTLFKASGITSRIFAAVYMTGILPIKKDGSQSAISDFQEFTMVKPRKFGEFVGFTQKEVEELCEKNHADFCKMKLWYDGYSFKNVGSVYNPNSVIQAVRNEDFDSYWTETSAAESLMDYISRDYHGLSKVIAELIAGIDVKVNVTGFANDLVTFKGKDDVLTLLVHLGYLAYDDETKTVHIPNEEIRQEFARSVREVSHEETKRRVAECDRLLYDTIHLNEEAVAGQIEKIHSEETSVRHYNREEDLRGVIKLAYFTYKDHYLQWEELPAGEGYADILYLPKRDSDYPALLIELKWNKSAEGAMKQILDRKYPDALKGYGGELILAGINYDKDAPPGKRKHSCRLEKIQL